MLPKNITVVVGGPESPNRPSYQLASVNERCKDIMRGDKSLHSLANRELKRYKLNFMQWLMLGVIDRGPDTGLSVTNVADQLGISLGQASTLGSSLVVAKLARQRTQLSDHRNRHLLLSARGRVVLENSDTAVSASFDVWLKTIPKQQLTFYHRVSKALAHQKVDVLK